MCQDFESSGTRPIIFLHVNIEGGGQPLKPVEISFPISAVSVKRKNIIILQSDYGDDFEDATKHISFVWSKNRITLKVLHFTKYVAFYIKTVVAVGQQPFSSSEIFVNIHKYLHVSF